MEERYFVQPFSLIIVFGVHYLITPTYRDLYPTTTLIQV